LLPSPVRWPKSPAADATSLATAVPDLHDA
jgi:hypothetical protein